MPLCPRRYRGLALLLLAIVFSALLVSPLSAMIEVATGNDPVTDSNWPAGSVDVANLKTRLGWWEGPPFGGGERTFEYAGDAAAFQQALDAFAKIKAPVLQLIVHDGGPMESFVLNDPKRKARYDWSFTVWNPQSWNQLFNAPDSFAEADEPSGSFRSPVAAPRIDLFAGAGGIDYSKIKVPANVTITDERADAAGFAGGSAVVCDVYDQLTSKPIADAKVTLSTQKEYNVWIPGAAAETDASGHAELLKAPAGHFGVVVSCPGYASRVIGRANLRGNTLKRFTTQLAPTAVLRGTVTDTVGKVLPGVTIRADTVLGPDGRGYIVPDRAAVTADEHGHFEIAGLPRGHVQLYASGKNFAMLDFLKLRAVPDEQIAMRMTATGSLKVTVLTKNGEPAAHGNIEVNPPGGPKVGSWGGSADTAADGTHTFESLPPGEYAVTAMATNPGNAPPDGKDPSEKRVIVKAGEVTEVVVTGR